MKLSVTVERAWACSNQTALGSNPNSLQADCAIYKVVTPQTPHGRVKWDFKIILFILIGIVCQSGLLSMGKNYCTQNEPWLTSGLEGKLIHKL